MEEFSDFGAFAPKGARAGLISLSRRTVLGRGHLRHWLWRRLGFGEEEAVDIMVGPVKMRLYPASNSVEQKLLQRPENYCPQELAALNEALGVTGRFVDIGANIGAFSLPLAAGFPQRKILAIEPNPAAHGRLMFNQQANRLDNMVIDVSALSEKVGVVSFTADPKDLKLSGINPPHGKGASIKVPTKPLASLLEEYDMQAPEALKIDVEGHEDKILLPFFRQTDKNKWPRFIVIEAIKREGLPNSIDFMLKNGYYETFRNRANRGFVLGG